MLRALLLPNIAAALLGGPAFTATRCTYEEVSELASPSEAVDGDVWVKVTENAAPSLDLASAMADCLDARWQEIRWAAWAGS